VMIAKLYGYEFEFGSANRSTSSASIVVLNVGGQSLNEKRTLIGARITLSEPSPLNEVTPQLPAL
jgi:hypothetical protein